MDQPPYDPPEDSQSPSGDELPIEPFESHEPADAPPEASPASREGDALPSPPERREGFLGDLLQLRYREVTFSAMAFAIVIGIVLNAAITYAGLKIGFTIGGSAIAAVLGFGVLRGILRKGTILETNVAQTVASAVNTSNSGIIFTVPVLFLMGFNLSIGGSDFWLIMLACIGGAFLGTAFIIPLRKQMLDIERLRFPSPTGVATILKSPGAGTAKSVVLVLGVLLGAAIYAPSGLPAITLRADLAELDQLVEDGKISADSRALTLEIDGMITANAGPEGLAELGALHTVAERASAAVRSADANNRALLKTRIERADDAELAVTNYLSEHAELSRYDKALAMAVFRATEEEDDWDDLRSKSFGWAAKPLWGYSDAKWRLPVTDEDAVDGVLATRVDRDHDGKADLIMNNDEIDVGRWIGLPDQFLMLFAIAPFALGAGYITGRAGLFVLAGGVLAFFVLNPVAYSQGWIPASVSAAEVPGYAFTAFNRPLGIGLLLGGAMMGVLFSLPSIRQALKSILFAGKSRGGGEELGFRTLIVAVVGGLIFLFIAADFVGNKPINTACPITMESIVDEVPSAQYEGYAIGFATDQASETWTSEWTDVERDAFLVTLNAKPGWLSSLSPHLRAAIIAIIGAIWIWFAGIIIAQCAGMTDWSPISGLALITVVLILMLAGTGAVVGAVLIGAALCVAITLAADMMGDMKTGYLVGAKPKRQQTVELIVVGIGPVVCMLTLMLIVAANQRQTGIPIGPGTATVAPQAQALQAVITGVQGGEMPYALYGAGAGLGAMLGLGAFPGLGVLVGLSMYLPFKYIATYGIGCVAAILIGRLFGKSKAEAWGVPFCAGLIVGESILSLIINIIVLVGG